MRTDATATVASAQINRQILHSFTDIELHAALGIDVRDISVARNGWQWSAEVKLM